jgi:hypothetical protein|tara:strand:+ start:586 stop:759 length:174 start_codon:yes stop_codon:yes gene_type:complete
LPLAEYKYDGFGLGLIDLSYPPLLATIFVSDKAESTPFSLPYIKWSLELICTALLAA